MRRTVLAMILALAAAGPVPAQDGPRFPAGVTWVAVSLGDTPFEPGAAPTLKADDAGRITGSTGCNRYGGLATISSAGFTAGGMMMSKMFCAGAGGANERTFSAALRAATGWRMDGAALLIETGKGPLRFKRK